MCAVQLHNHPRSVFPTSGWAKEGREDHHGGVCNKKSQIQKKKKKRGYYYYYKRSWGGKQQVSKSVHCRQSMLWLQHGRKRWSDKQQLLQEGGSPFSPTSLPPSLTFSLPRPLPQQRFFSPSQSPRCDGWGDSAEDESGARASTLSLLPCPACSFVNSKVHPTFPEMRIYFWGRRSRGRGSRKQQGGQFCQLGVRRTQLHFAPMFKKGWWRKMVVFWNCFHCLPFSFDISTNISRKRFFFLFFFSLFWGGGGGGELSLQIGYRSFLLRVISQRRTARFSGGACPLARGSCELLQEAQTERSHRGSPAVTLHRSQLSETGSRPGR